MDQPFGSVPIVFVAIFMVVMWLQYYRAYTSIYEDSRAIQYATGKLLVFVLFMAAIFLIMRLALRQFLRLPDEFAGFATVVVSLIAARGLFGPIERYFDARLDL